MFLNLRSLIAKPTKADSYTAKSLSKPTLFYLEGEAVTEFRYHIVEAEEEMRPDLVSERFFGHTGFTDLICKYNNIYNPFSLERGDLIKVPYKAELYYSSAGEPDKIIDKGTIKAAPNFVAKSTKDTKRLAYLQQIAKNKGVDSAAALQNGAELGSISVPPNFNLPNQSNIKKENGLIIFGGDVTGAGTKGTVTPVSRTTVVNKINGTA